MKLTRSYNLKIIPNYQKLEDIRYNSSRYILYLQHFVTQLYYNKHIRFFSTKGLGTLANQAQKQAMGIVACEKAATIALNNKKTSCPQIKYSVTPAKIQANKTSSYDYWIKVSSQFNNKILVPAMSHKALNLKLKDNWKLSDYCELYKAKNDKWYARVYVTKEVAKAIPKAKSLGCDVGVAHGVSRSDNYLGKNLKPIIKAQKLAQAERSRQGLKKNKLSLKTRIKQQLDLEVKLALARCQKNSLNLAVENPKILANLKSGKLDKWARCYFANRAIILAQEKEVWVQPVNPAYTSITCAKCGHIDKLSRAKQDKFICTACGNTLHADINAARNIALKGQVKLADYIAKYKLNRLANKEPGKREIP